MWELIDNIFEKIDYLIDLVLPYVAPNNNFRYIQYAIAALIAFGIFCLLYYFRRNKIIENSIRNGYEQLIKKKLGLKSRKVSTKKNEKDDRLEMLRHLDTEATSKKRLAFLESFDEQFTYSRLDSKIPFLTSDIWLAFIILVFLLSFTLFSAITKDVIYTLAFSVAVTMIPILIEWNMAYLNYRAVDKEIIQFLNLLGNYSATSGELTTVFKAIKNKLSNPLRSVIEDAIYDTDAYGADIALVRLANKIEHPKFKLIIHDMRVAIKYSSSFKIVVDNNRMSITNYKNYTRQRDNLAMYDVLTLLFVTGMSVIVTNVMGKILEMDMLDFFLHTRQGNISLLVDAGVYIFFILMIYKIKK